MTRRFILKFTPHWTARKHNWFACCAFCVLTPKRPIWLGVNSLEVADYEYSDQYWGWFQLEVSCASVATSIFEFENGCTNETLCAWSA